MFLTDVAPYHSYCIRQHSPALLSQKDTNIWSEEKSNRSVILSNPQNSEQKKSNQKDSTNSM